MKGILVDVKFLLYVRMCSISVEYPEKQRTMSNILVYFFLYNRSRTPTSSPKTKTKNTYT